MSLSDKDVKQLNQFQGFLSFKHNWPFRKFVSCAHKIVLLIYGNQSGKTGGTAYNYVLRVLGQHPIAKKNVVYYECSNDHQYAPITLPEDNKCTECGEELKLHERSSRVFRFCSATLPGQSDTISESGESAEVKNTQYPEFKKWLPPFLIKKDITARHPSMIISDPFGGKDIIVEFVSYNQTTMSTAGVQRLSIWCDESPTMEFYNEQIPRLLAENGDMVFTYTPVDKSSWLFDEFYDKASDIYRSRYIVDYLSKLGEEVKDIEDTGNPYSIAVIMAATDDNPTLDSAVIDSMFDHIDDPDVVSIRRYGIFKQLSGRIFKDFDYSVHFIPTRKYFEDGVPDHWTHARGIDYHPQTNWAYGQIALSPTNEAFIYRELNPSPEKFTTKEMAKFIAEASGEQKFKLNKIDPYATAVKHDTRTILDDLNKEVKELEREGVGRGGYFSSWDTKGEKGRDAIRERLKNARACERPFNNKVIKDGLTTYLPTIWILDVCPISAKYMKNWRWQEWANKTALHTKVEKNMPEQKWSHFNMVWEAIFKESGFRPPVYYKHERVNADYFRRVR